MHCSLYFIPRNAIPIDTGGTYGPPVDRYVDRPLSSGIADRGCFHLVTIRNRSVTINFNCHWSISSGISRGREKEEEGEEEEGEEKPRVRRCSSLAGDFFSLHGEKKHLPTWREGTSDKIRTAWYIPVRQLIGRYWAVPLRSAVDGRFPPSAVDLRRNRASARGRKRKEEEEEKKKKRSTSRRPSGDSARGSPVSRRRPRCHSAVIARAAHAVVALSLPTLPFAISTCTARYGRYISIRQVTSTRIARYRAVPSKIDRWRPIEEEIDVDGRLRKKKGRKRGKEKRRRGEERIPRPLVVAVRGSPARRCNPRPRPLFLPREETERLPAQGDRSRQHHISLYFQIRMERMKEVKRTPLKRYPHDGSLQRNSSNLISQLLRIGREENRRL
ncbi:hypothetical protein BHM03_00016277 [Ensete ventricosum]|nr:hypothetical protein BHM03_00016277 [Ensete ventricosum]